MPTEGFARLWVAFLARIIALRNHIGSCIAEFDCVFFAHSLNIMTTRTVELFCVCVQDIGSIRCRRVGVSIRFWYRSWNRRRRLRGGTRYADVFVANGRLLGVGCNRVVWQVRIVSAYICLRRFRLYLRLTIYRLTVVCRSGDLTCLNLRRIGVARIDNGGRWQR